MSTSPSVEVAKIGAYSDNLQELIKQSGGIIQKLLEVAKSNPLVGLFLCIVLTDILQRTHVLYDDTANTVRLGLYALGGIGITGGVVSIVNDLLGKDATVQLLKTSLVTDAHSEPESRKIVNPSAEETDGKAVSDQLQKLLPVLTQLAATAA